MHAFEREEGIEHAIGEIKSGELVLAFDFNEGQWVARRVEERHDSEYIGALITLTTDRGTVRTTMYHPFWVISGNELPQRSNPRELAEREDEGLSLPGRWVNSHELRAGDILIGQDGRRQRVLKLEQEYHEYFPVSNLTIQGDHTFAVGPDRLLVHNTADCLKISLEEAIENGLTITDSPWNKPHGNSLDASGPHDVYVIRDAHTRQLLHFGETGRGYYKRFLEHQRDFAELGIDVIVDLLDTIEGKAAAKLIESRYIETFKSIFGHRPPFNSSNH